MLRRSIEHSLGCYLSDIDEEEQQRIHQQWAQTRLINDLGELMAEMFGVDTVNEAVEKGLYDRMRALLPPLPTTEKKRKVGRIYNEPFYRLIQSLDGIVYHRSFGRQHLDRGQKSVNFVLEICKIV